MLKSSILTFLQVCRSGSFTRAAAQLFVTPSAVMQQMDALEHEYGIALFIRTHHGVQLTPGGAYLYEQAQDLARRSEDIRSRLQAIASENDMICVGTSLVEKCRLLYDLWSLYSADNQSCRIQMVNIDTASAIPDCADMVESVNCGIGWMRNWQFFEICQVPIGIALEESHPLARKSVIEVGDLSGEQVGSFRRTAYVGEAELHRRLEETGAEVVWQNYPTPSTFWECAFQHRLLLAPLCWSDILPSLTLRPMHWEYALPYGIFYRHKPRQQAESFLRFIRTTYTDPNPDGIVPMLTY